MDPSRPAGEVWGIRRKPVDILGRLMFRVDFQLQGWEITIHHKMCDTLEQADAECHNIAHDLTYLADGAFRQKYRIAHDLRGGF